MRNVKIIISIKSLNYSSLVLKNNWLYLLYINNVAFISLILVARLSQASTNRCFVDINWDLEKQYRLLPASYPITSWYSLILLRWARLTMLLPPILDGFFLFISQRLRFPAPFPSVRPWLWPTSHPETKQDLAQYQQGHRLPEINGVEVGCPGNRIVPQMHDNKWQAE